MTWKEKVGEAIKKRTIRLTVNAVEEDVVLLGAMKYGPQEDYDFPRLGDIPPEPIYLPKDQ